MKTTKGDLIKLVLDGEFDVIVHGCNCFCEMGAGIAKGIRQNFPEAYDADCKTEKGSKDKLGDISYATVERNGREITVVNAYTQHHWRSRVVLVDYDAVRSAMRKIKRKFAGKRIGYPKIGAGMARGDWDRLAAIIDTELDGTDHTLVEYQP